MRRSKLYFLDSSLVSSCTVVSILSVCPAAGTAVKDYVLDPVLMLSTSALLQGPALDSLLTALKQMIVNNAIDFPELHTLLREKLTAQTGKQGIYNLSKCIAAITATSSFETSQGVLNEIVSLLNGSNTPDDITYLSKIHLSLLITGDLGRVLDLSTMNGHAIRLRDIYIGFFESSSEELKNAAAYALGSAAVGSPTTFLHAIVGQLDDDSKKHQYLLLSALREFIQCSSRKVGYADVDKSTTLSVVIPALERHCSDEEEGVRTMVAECLGSLTCAQPDIILKNLEEWQALHYEPAIGEDDTAMDKNALFCWTIATAVKLAISGKVDSSLLPQSMSTFVKLLQHSDLHVRNSALLMIYSAVHHMPIVVSDIMKDSIMPSLYEVAKLKLERKVDLGPFTHTVDDALPLRKTALSIFATCLESVPGSVDVAEFLLVLGKSFGDAEDIQLHAHQIVISMCTRQPSSVVASLETFVDPLEKTINKKPGEKTGTELERLNDWIKSALRVMLTFSKLDGAMNSRKFTEFYERVKGNSKFSSLLNALEEEH
jgi:cullin-associated NEDD8-dissociated protein 1